MHQSLTNYTGLVSDFAKNRLGLPRSYSLVLVSFFFFISQVTAANVDDIHNLWMASLLLGLAHGSVFSLFPTVCLEWFGMRTFLAFIHVHQTIQLTVYLWPSSALLRKLGLPLNVTHARRKPLLPHLRAESRRTRACTFRAHHVHSRITPGRAS